MSIKHWTSVLGLVAFIILTVASGIQPAFIAQAQDPDLAYQEALRRILAAKDTGATELSLQGLGLTEIPPQIGQLEKLGTLILSDNALNSLPPELSQLPYLNVLELDGNPLLSPPPDVVLQGTEAVLEYLREKSEIVTGQEKTSPLLEMLALVPNGEYGYYHNQLGTVQFADFHALYTVEDIEDLRTTLDTEALLDAVPSFFKMTYRIRAGLLDNGILSFAYYVPRTMGFDLIQDVDCILEFGASPYNGLILGGDFDAAAVGAALSTRESYPFEQSDVNGVTVWHRFDDGTQNPAMRDPADPFYGHLGGAARIAILPGYLAGAQVWEITEHTIAAAQGEYDTLADDPAYRALADAITAPDGWLIQALFFDPADIGVIPEETRLSAEDFDAITEEYGSLKPYQLAVLADRQEGQDQVNLIGLVYPDAVTAANAAEEVARRLNTLTERRSGENIVEQFGAQVSSYVYESESTGNAVAIIEARYPLPEDRIDAETNEFIIGGLLYRFWTNEIQSSKFFLLLISPS